jgi:hypothetical protein
MNFVRAISSEGFGRLNFYRKVRGLLDEDRAFRDFFEGETTRVPQFYLDIIKKRPWLALGMASGGSDIP